MARKNIGATDDEQETKTVNLHLMTPAVAAATLPVLKRRPAVAPQLERLDCPLACPVFWTRSAAANRMRTEHKTKKKISRTFLRFLYLLLFKNLNSSQHWLQLRQLANHRCGAEIGWEFLVRVVAEDLHAGGETCF